MFINKNKSVKEFENLIKLNYTATKIYLYFSIKTASEGYDPYENNLTTTNLNPKTIKAYVRHLTAEQVLYKGYGTEHTGAVEIICEEKYLDWFETVSKIVINDNEYKVLSTGNAEGSSTTPKTGLTLIRPFNMGKVVLARA